MCRVLTLEGTGNCFCFVAVYQPHVERSLGLCDHTGAVCFVVIPPVADCRGVAVPGLLIQDEDHDSDDAEQHDDEKNQGHGSTLRFWSERRKEIPR